MTRQIRTENGFVEIYENRDTVQVRLRPEQVAQRIIDLRAMKVAQVAAIDEEIALLQTL